MTASNTGPEVEFVILGSGTSHGVPMIGCTCEVCQSEDPRDQRSRCSVFVRSGKARFLIDTAPELRLQCIQQGIDRVDAVLFTHHHADHVMGLDDLRRFNWLMKREIDCYGSHRTLTALQTMFPYAFKPDADSQSSKPELNLNVIDAQPFQTHGASVLPIPLFHGDMPVLGFRFGPFAYCTDCSRIPDDSLDRLEDLDVLVLDGLRRRPHPTHFNLEQAVEMAQRINARQTYLTHIAHELMHADTNASLPERIALAYDGLRGVLPGSGDAKAQR